MSWYVPMTILDCCFDIIRITGYENYDKNYDYWSINESGTFLYMTCKRNFDFLCGVSNFSQSDVAAYIPYLNKNLWQDKPLFIPYEELKPYEEISIEFECSVKYEFSQKYPLVCVRGACDKQCGNKDLRTYCFHGIPCMTNRPDWNCYSNKYPNFFDLLFSVVNWVKECKGIDALVVMFSDAPTDYEKELDFNYCTAMLIHQNNIKVIRDSKGLYDKYNRLYPTEDKQIELSISRPEDGFYFRF